jgi:DNA polymerase elongation subunit (family B)
MNNQKDLIFQIIDWSTFHKETDDERLKFTIRLFGMTEDKKTIYVEVNKFTPYFYVEVPDDWNQTHADELYNFIKWKVYKKYRDNNVKVCIIKKYKFWGFTNQKKFKFVKFVFDDYETFKKFRWELEKEITIQKLRIYKKKLKLYEANIEPMLRCMHTRNLQACGWIKILGNDYSVVDKNDLTTYCQINIITDFTKLNLYEGKESDIQPFQ